MFSNLSTYTYLWSWVQPPRGLRPWWAAWWCPSRSHCTTRTSASWPHPRPRWDPCHIGSRCCSRKTCHSCRAWSRTASRYLLYLLSNILVTLLIICIHPKIFLDCTQKAEINVPWGQNRRKVDYHLVIHDVERVGPGPCLRLDIDTVVLVNGALAEDDPIEGSVEADLDLHVGLATHDLKAGDVGHVRRALHIPEVQVILTEDSGKQ